MKLVTNVFRTEPVGGVELHVFQVSGELARRGHQVDLLCAGEGSLDADYRRFCHSVTRVPSVDYWFPGADEERHSNSSSGSGHLAHRLETTGGDLRQPHHVRRMGHSRRAVSWVVRWSTTCTDSTTLTHAADGLAQPAGRPAT